MFEAMRKEFVEARGVFVCVCVCARCVEWGEVSLGTGFRVLVFIKGLGFRVLKFRVQGFGGIRVRAMGGREDLDMFAIESLFMVRRFFWT